LSLAGNSHGVHIQICQHLFIYCFILYYCPSVKTTQGLTIDKINFHIIIAGYEYVLEHISPKSTPSMACELGNCVNHKIIIGWWRNDSVMWPIIGTIINVFHIITFKNSLGQLAIRIVWWSNKLNECRATICLVNPWGCASFITKISSIEILSLCSIHLQQKVCWNIRTKIQC